MQTRFMWAWSTYPAQPDPSMTRHRAARLLWAWRRTSRKPTSMGSCRRTLRRIAPHVYRVTDSGEIGTMTIIRGKA